MGYGQSVSLLFRVITIQMFINPVTRRVGWKLLNLAGQFSLDLLKPGLLKLDIDIHIF